MTCHVRPKQASIGVSRVDEPIVTFDGTVLNVTNIGKRYDLNVRLDTDDELLVERIDAPPTVGDRITVGFDPRSLVVLEPIEREGHRALSVPGGRETDL